MSQVHSCFGTISLPCAALTSAQCVLKPVLECVLKSGIGLLAADPAGHCVGCSCCTSSSKHVSVAFRNSHSCLIDHDHAAAVATLAAASLCVVVSYCCWLQLLMRCCSVTAAACTSLCGTASHQGVLAAIIRVCC